MLPDLYTQYAAITGSCGLLSHETHAFTALEGPGAAEFLQGQVTNDIENCPPGSGVYAVLLTPKGKIRMDMRLLRTEQGVIADYALDRKDIFEQTIRKFRIGYKFEMTDQSPALRLLELIGPSSDSFVRGVAAAEHSHRLIQMADAEVRAVRTHWGLDLFVPASAVGDIEAILVEAGITLVTEEAAEIRRVEIGRPRLGFEFDDDEIPQEVRLNESAVNFEKGCYVGQETVARLFYKGKPNRLLQGLKLTRAVDQGAPVRARNREVGVIGSVAESPTHGPIALAVLRHEVAPGDQVAVGEENIGATVVEPGSLATA